MNKKGAEMTIGTIIIIILALVVLVVLIYGFTTGWGNLWDKILGVGGGKENVQSVVDACRVACTTQAKYDFCQRQREITFRDPAGTLQKVDASCEELKNKAKNLPPTGLTCDLSCA